MTSLSGNWMIQSSALSEEYVVVQFFLTELNGFVTGSLSTLSVAAGVGQLWEVQGNEVSSNVNLVFQSASGGPRFVFSGRLGADGIALGALSGSITDDAAKLVSVEVDHGPKLAGIHSLSGAGVPSRWVVLDLFLNQMNDSVSGSLDLSVDAQNQRWTAAGNNVLGSVDIVFRSSLDDTKATFTGSMAGDGSARGTLTYEGASGPAVIAPVGSTQR